MPGLSAGRELDVRIQREVLRTDVQQRQTADGELDYFYFDEVVVRSIPPADDPFDFSGKWIRVPDYSTDAESARLVEEYIQQMGGSVHSEYVGSLGATGCWCITVEVLKKGEAVKQEAVGESYALSLCRAALAAAGQ